MTDKNRSRPKMETSPVEFKTAPKEITQKTFTESIKTAARSPEQERVHADQVALETLKSIDDISPDTRKALLLKLIDEELQEEARRPASLAEDINAAESADPALRFIHETILQALAIARGKRLVDSKSADESIRAARERLAERRNGGFFKRLFGGSSSDTAIIKEHEAVLTEVENLKHERTRLAGELAALEQKKLELVEKATNEAKQIVAVTSANMQEAETKLASLRAEIARLESYRGELKNEPAVKKEEINQKGAPSGNKTRQ